MLRVVTWLPLCWHRLNRSLSNCELSEATIGIKTLYYERKVILYKFCLKIEFIVIKLYKLTSFITVL